MALQLVEVTIDENGDSEVDMNGFNGKGCGAIQEALSNATGKAVQVTHKTEFHKPCLQKTKLSNRG